MGLKSFAYDGIFWRRIAALGAQRFHPWWLRYSPPVFGVAAAALLPNARRTVRRNLQRIRGQQPLWRDVVDTASTFSSFAGCFAESLAQGSKNGAPAEVAICDGENMHGALAEKKGLLLLTMHTGGWEVAGPLFAEHAKLDIILVMEGERDLAARAMSDRARQFAGVRIMHVGPDPLAALPLVRHLSETKGVVALQVDRPAPSGRVVPVQLLGRAAMLPEGPFRLAQLTGAPLVPVFCARQAFRHYTLRAFPARRLPRHPPREEVERVAQTVADDMTAFLRAHPTQWFQF